MTLEYIERRLEEIRALATDPEAAHVEQDNLYEQVLWAIAEGRCKDPARCALAALETGKIEFPRHYS